MVFIVIEYWMKNFLEESKLIFSTLNMFMWGMGNYFLLIILVFYLVRRWNKIIIILITCFCRVWLYNCTNENDIYEAVVNWSQLRLIYRDSRLLITAIMSWWPCVNWFNSLEWIDRSLTFWEVIEIYFFRI